jgi:hypothetical protein
MEAISKELSPGLSPGLATVEGLDELFEPDTGRVTTVTPDPNLSSDITAEGTMMWTLQDAAENLGLSTRTILRRLKSGAIQGYKVTGLNGPEWRIKPQDDQSVEGEAVMPSVKTVTSDTPSSPDTSHDSYVVDLNKQLLQQVQSLAYKNGMLEAQLNQREQQLEERDQKILLLTDSQRSWWSRFSNWFLGKP